MTREVMSTIWHTKNTYTRKWHEKIQLHVFLIVSTSLTVCIKGRKRQKHVNIHGLNWSLFPVTKTKHQSEQADSHKLNNFVLSEPCCISSPSYKRAREEHVNIRARGKALFLWPMEPMRRSLLAQKKKHFVRCLDNYISTSSLHATYSLDANRNRQANPRKAPH